MRINLMLLGSAVGSRFFDDLPSDAVSCTPSMRREVEEKYPGLHECYSRSSLFFGTTATPCSERCLDITVQASKHVAEACKLEAPNANYPIISNKERIYVIWGNLAAAKVVCAKNAARGLHCLDEFSRVSSQLSLRLRPLNPVTPDKACTKCTRELYNMFNTNGYLMPVLYYQTIPDPNTTFRNLGSICGY